MNYCLGLPLARIVFIHLHSFGLRSKGHVTAGDLGHCSVRMIFFDDAFSVLVAQLAHLTVAYWFELTQRRQQNCAPRLEGKKGVGIQSGFSEQVQLSHKIKKKNTADLQMLHHCQNSMCMTIQTSPMNKTLQLIRSSQNERSMQHLCAMHSVPYTCRITIQEHCPLICLMEMHHLSVSECLHECNLEAVFLLSASVLEPSI